MTTSGAQSHLTGAVLEAVQKLRGDSFSDELAASLTAVVHAPKDARKRALVELRDSLAQQPSSPGLGLLTVWFGANVEAGGKPENTYEPILALFRRVLGEIRTSDDEEQQDPVTSPEILDCAQFVGQSLVAHLSRLPDQRAILARNEEFLDELDRVEHLSVGAMWVQQLMSLSSGRLVVLHIESGTGAIVEYRNLANCFHLFTLLQAALPDLIPEDDPLDPHVIELARGTEEGQGFDHARWHFGQVTSPTPDIAHCVWGEPSPESIARIEGQRVVLLWPKQLEGRSWDANFFKPILSAQLPYVEVIEKIDREQTEDWLRRIGVH